MNNQLKLLLYIVFIVGVLFFLQDNFDFLDVSFQGKNQTQEDSQEGDPDTTEDDIVVENDENYVDISVGDGESIRVDVEIADTEPLRALGLSNRRYLGDYNGMLFVYDEKVNHPFWMKDTLINLDIIFIDEKGFIVDIQEDNEPCTDVHCPAITSSKQYKYVLEVNGGFCKINDVEVGQSLVIYLASSN